MARSNWRTVHKASGATVIERHAQGCKLTVVPEDWVRPRGAARWAISCGGEIDRVHGPVKGSASSVKNAKHAATRAAAKAAAQRDRYEARPRRLFRRRR
jgi:hypothetical protein